MSAAAGSLRPTTYREASPLLGHANTLATPPSRSPTLSPSPSPSLSSSSSQFAGPAAAQLPSSPDALERRGIPQLDDGVARARAWSSALRVDALRERIGERPWQWALAAQRSESRATQLVGVAATGSVGLAISLGIAIALGATLTPLLLQLSVTGGATQGMAAQLYILGDALSLLFGQGAGPFGNLTTVVNMAALTRAMIGQGDAHERRHAWLMAQAALGLALSPLFVGGLGIGAAGTLAAIAAGAALSVWTASSAASRAEPSYRLLLMGVAIGVAVAPMSSKLALGQGLARVVGEALECPTIAAAALVLWDFWQSIQSVRRSPASGQPELDLTHVPPQMALDFVRPDCTHNARLAPLPRKPSLIGIERVEGLEDSAKAQFIDWYSDDTRLQKRERKQWLFWGQPGVGKRSTIAGLARFYDALLLEITPAELARVADNPPEGGFLHASLTRAEFLTRKHNRMVIVGIHNVEQFLAPESEAGKTSAVDSSDLLDSLTCNHPRQVPPLLIVGTTEQPLHTLPKRLVERFTRRYEFALDEPSVAYKIFEQKLEQAFEAALPAGIRQPQLKPEQLASAARHGVGQGLGGGDFERYAYTLVSHYCDRLKAQGGGMLSPTVGLEPLDLGLMHERQWPDFLLLMGNGNLSPRPKHTR